MNSFASPPPARLPAALSRAEHGRWLGGVCAGLAQARGISVWWPRAAFVLTALAGGLGALVYVACVLIIPAEGEELEAAEASRGIVALAQVCAGCAGLVTLGAAGAAATVFGFGWVVLALAAAVLAGALLSWPRVGPVWVLLPITALALPSVALAAGGVRLAPQSGSVTVAPRALADVPADGYRSGLGPLLVDLRRTELRADRPTHVRIEAGVRRTIVALPHDRCVPVQVNFDIDRFASRVAEVLSGRSRGPFSQVVVFGMTFGTDGVYVSPAAERPGLTIDFHSGGGGLYVRDYPDDVDPGTMPDWPGYSVNPEPRPNVTGTPRRAAQRLLRTWRTRHAEQLRSMHRIDALQPGPCAKEAGR